MDRDWRLAIFTVTMGVGGAFVTAGAIAKDNWSASLVVVGFLTIGIGLLAFLLQCVEWKKGPKHQILGPRTQTEEKLLEFIESILALYGRYEDWSNRASTTQPTWLCEGLQKIRDGWQEQRAHINAHYAVNPDSGLRSAFDQMAQTLWDPWGLKPICEAGTDLFSTRARACMLELKHNAEGMQFNLLSCSTMRLSDILVADDAYPITLGQTLKVVQAKSGRQRRRPPAIVWNP
jgi:hypothetical protein